VGVRNLKKRAENEVVPFLNKAPCSKLMWQVELWLHLLLSLALDGKRFASRPGLFNSEESASSTP